LKNIFEREVGSLVFLDRRDSMASIEECSLMLACADELESETDVAVLVKTYSSLLFRVTYSVLRCRTESEDVVQDVFLKVVEHQRTLKDVRDTRVWLIRIAWNMAIDRRRRIRPEQMEESFVASLVTNSVPADRSLDEAQRMRAVLRELEKLPKTERQVLLLSSVEELEAAEIAKVIGRSESAVRALLFRARTRLRERLDR
jgi:RNA polymerase sigma-70 factor (ECF subfamily)